MEQAARAHLWPPAPPEMPRPRLAKHESSLASEAHAIGGHREAREKISATCNTKSRGAVVDEALAIFFAERPTSGCICFLRGPHRSRQKRPVRDADCREAAETAGGLAARSVKIIWRRAERWIWPRREYEFAPLRECMSLAFKT